MSLRVFNQRFLEPGSIWFMVVGILCLCQPWIGVLHAYSVGIMLIGLIGFNVAVHIPPPEKAEIEDEAVSIDETVRQGGGHG